MMTSDVLITIKGLQMALDSSDCLEIITNGKYFKKNGKHYVLYEEVVEDQRVSNMIKIHDETVEITKKGLASVQMFFETGRKIPVFILRRMASWRSVSMRNRFG